MAVLRMAETGCLILALVLTSSLAAGLFPITISKEVGNLFGGDSLIVTGLSFREDDEITCTFGDMEVDGIYLDGESALCVTPAAPELKETLVNLEVRVRRGSAGLFGGTTFRYISPDEEPDSGSFQPTEDVLAWNVGSIANISWLPSSLLSGYTNSSTVRVDIALWTYDEASQRWEEETILATDLPNSGFASIALPHIPSLNLTKYQLKPAVLELSVNMATAKPVAKRSTRQVTTQTVMNLLRKVRKWTKVGAIGYAKPSTALRLLCEAWHKIAATVPERSLPPCPCNTSQASRDVRYQNETGIINDVLRKYIFHKGSSSCYRQVNVQNSGPGQQCCYDDKGNIMAGPPNGGTADLVAPTDFKTQIDHFLVDVVPFFLCCTGPFKDCSRYFDRRPSDDCSDYPNRPPLR